MHFGSVLRSKIDLGGAWERKGGSLKTYVLLKENHSFRARREPGAPQIHLGTALKFQQEFVWIFDFKMTPKRSQNGAPNGDQKAPEIIKKSNRKKYQK